MNNYLSIRMRFVASIALISALFAMFLSISVASAHYMPKPHTWHALVGVETKNHATQGMAFLPQTLWINTGDTVVWTAKSADIHTVTFLKPGQTLPPFDPNDPMDVLPQGSHVYDGKSYYNSGLVADFPGLPGGNGYSLSFGVVGDFVYYCLVHPSMIAVIHVRPAGTSYPFSQHDYDHQITHQTKAIFADGRKLADIAEDKSNNRNVTFGIGDGLASVMRIFPQRIVIHVNDTITFTNRDVMEPHVVSYGVFPPNFNDFVPAGNPKHFDGSSILNSGFIGASPAWFGTSYQVTFVKAGTYAFRCDIHDQMGMVATIVVRS